MTPTEAQKKLAERRRRNKRKRGPPSEQFTETELKAVSVLAHNGRTQETIAQASGMSLASFKRAFERDEKLRDAWLIGKAKRREQRIRDLEKESRNGNVRATELLLRYEHGDPGPGAKGGGRADVTVNINANTLPRAQDGRSYAALMKNIQDKREPVVVEHGPLERPTEIDPIGAVKEKQQRAQ